MTIQKGGSWVTRRLGAKQQKKNGELTDNNCDWLLTTTVIELLGVAPPETTNDHTEGGIMSDHDDGVQNDKKYGELTDYNCNWFLGD